MKKSILFLSFVILCSMIGFSQGKTIPEVVTSNFNKQYPKASDIEWTIVDYNYEVEFQHNGLEMEILYDEKGTTLETEVELSEEQLPAIIYNYVNEKYAGYAIDELIKIMKGKTTFYEVQLENKKETVELLFNESGKLLEEEIEMNGAEEPDQDHEHGHKHDHKHDHD